MINKILPISFKGTTETKTSENNATQQAMTAPIVNTNTQSDTFTNTSKKSNNGSLFAGIMGIMDMVNTLISMSSKK